MHLHGEGRRAFRTHGRAHVAVVDRQGDDVLFGDAVAPQLPDEVPCVGARHLEDGEAAHVGEEGGLHGGGEVGELGEGLGGQHEGGTVLAQLREHRLVVDARHGLHLVHDDERAPAVRQWQLLSCSRMTASTRLRMEAPTRAATSRPAVPWAVETKRMPPSRMVRRRSMVERGCPRTARATFEEA